MSQLIKNYNCIHFSHENYNNFIISVILYMLAELLTLINYFNLITSACMYSVQIPQLHAKKFMAILYIIHE